jgi:hypothetical protein
VRDAKSPHLPLARATVSVRDASNVEVSRPFTNDYGYFRIDLLTPGNYAVTASRNGYKSITQPVTVSLSDSNPDGSINFPMSEKVELSLVKGWNFISFPKVPAPSDMATIMTNAADARIIWAYDSPSQTWKKWTPAGGMRNTLSSLETGDGYWVYMNASGLIDLSEWEDPPSNRVLLSRGWNLVGYLGRDNAAATTELRGTTGGWSAVWNWTAGQWYGKHHSIPTLPAPIQPLTTFNQGKAYWIRIEASTASDWDQ